MRTRILLGISFLFYFAEAVLSCPVYRIGKLSVVDEHKKPVLLTTVWRYYSLTDSFGMRKGLAYDEDDSPDSNSYHFYSSGWGKRRRPDAHPADKYLRIQAPGYADVIIKTLEFRGNFDEEDVPELTVVMYPRKYVTKGDLVTLLDHYTCEKELKVKDSLTIGIRDYMEAIRAESTVSTANRNTGFIVQTYPNPVIDKLNIRINATLPKPYTAKLLDMQGKIVTEMELPDQNSVMDLQWEAKGLYVIQVFDPEGVLLYSLKFLKS
jgi:hypothetical protein